MSDKKELHSLKSSLLSRSLKMARMTLSTGTQLTGYGLNQLLQPSEKDKNWSAFLKKQAQTLTQDLGELKGSLMKAGQMLSIFGEYFLPQEANEFLKQLQSQSIPLRWELIQKQLKETLTEEQLSGLSIDSEALASASLGQVHRAQIKENGKWLAIKIQYPGVDKAIDSDLKALKMMLSLLKLLPKDFNVDALFSEVREMLVQETNYGIEAETTERFANLLKNDLRFIVPQVQRKFSSSKILATSLEKGFSADAAEIQSLSLERRNRLALNFLDLYFKELFEWGVVQTDPHLGNYKIQIDPNQEDKIVLLDFGAVRVYPDDFIVKYRKLIKASVLGDAQLVKSISEELKLTNEKENPQLQKIFIDFSFESVEPFRGGVYDWKNTDLPKRLSQKILQVFKSGPTQAPPKELVFLDRKTAGVFIFLSVLRAQIDARPLLMKYLDQIDF